MTASEKEGATVVTTEPRVVKTLEKTTPPLMGGDIPTTTNITTTGRRSVTMNNLSSLSVSSASSSSSSSSSLTSVASKKREQIKKQVAAKYSIRRFSKTYVTLLEQMTMLVVSSSAGVLTTNINQPEKEQHSFKNYPFIKELLKIYRLFPETKNETIVARLSPDGTTINNSLKKTGTGSIKKESDKKVLSAKMESFFTNIMKVWITYTEAYEREIREQDIRYFILNPMMRKIGFSTAIQNGLLSGYSLRRLCLYILYLNKHCRQAGLSYSHVNSLRPSDQSASRVVVVDETMSSSPSSIKSKGNVMISDKPRHVSQNLLRNNDQKDGLRMLPAHLELPNYVSKSEEAHLVNLGGGGGDGTDGTENEDGNINIGNILQELGNIFSPGNDNDTANDKSNKSTSKITNLISNLMSEGDLLKEATKLFTKGLGDSSEKDSSSSAAAAATTTAEQNNNLSSSASCLNETPPGTNSSSTTATAATATSTMIPPNGETMVPNPSRRKPPSRKLRRRVLRRLNNKKKKNKPEEKGDLTDGIMQLGKQLLPLASKMMNKQFLNTLKKKASKCAQRIRENNQDMDTSDINSVMKNFMKSVKEEDVKQIIDHLK